MASIYSQVWVDEHAVPDSTVIEYAFPAGSIYVVRDITGFVSTQLSAGVSLQAYDDKDVTFWYDWAALDGQSFYGHWQGRQVFIGGAGKLLLTCNSIGGGVVADFRVSGYALTP
jgi:hypothetical protein